MRIIRLRVTNVGGLEDCRIDFPDQQVIAFAGANGTGKSKLLNCLLGPWTHNLPPARDSEKEVNVQVEINFDPTEVEILKGYSREIGWADEFPESATITLRSRPLSGLSVESYPNTPAVTNAFTNPILLGKCPSLNLVYLPAERRLVESSRDSGVNLSQLQEDVGIQRLMEARRQGVSGGRLDDGEFESYAKALCVGSALPSENISVGSTESEASKWESFKIAVDDLLYPKKLLPLTRENPYEIRIGLPDGGTHRVHELSSGERQALIIISRVFRAGEGQHTIAIDEPDAYLHPALSSRLLQALRPGLGKSGKLIVATHSPSILDGIIPGAIFRLSHDRPAAVVEDEEKRLQLYREAGFRASSITQSELLVVVEGDFDETLLPQAIPEFSIASIRRAGGREQVLKTLESLCVYDLPIIGVVDSDILADSPAESISNICHVWPSADIEAVFLREDSVLDAAISGSLILPKYRSVDVLRDLLNEFVEGCMDQSIAEYAQRRLRQMTNIRWPSPRGNDPIGRLRGIVGNLPQLTESDVEEKIAEAGFAWDKAKPDLWTIVRGKLVLSNFANKVSYIKSGDALLSAIVARKPEIPSLRELAHLSQVVRERQVFAQK